MSRGSPADLGALNLVVVGARCARHLSSAIETVRYQPWCSVQNDMLIIATEILRRGLRREIGRGLGTIRGRLVVVGGWSKTGIGSLLLQLWKRTHGNRKQYDQRDCV